MANSAQTYRKPTQTAITETWNCLGCNFRVKSISRKPTNSNKVPIAMKSKLVQRTSLLNCIATNGMSSNIQLPTISQTKADLRCRISITDLLLIA